MWTIKLKDGTNINEVCYVATNENEDVLEYKTIYGVGVETKLSLCDTIKHVDGDIVYESKNDKMKKPSLEEVREYFKDAKLVKDISEVYNYTNGIFDITAFDELTDEGTEYHFGLEGFDNSENDEFVTLWNESRGYAEILEHNKKPMKKVIRLDEPKEESKKPKPLELTHVYAEDGMNEDEAILKDIDKVIYIGHCSVDDCDMFSVISGNGAISFWRGYLNDGVY